MNTEQSPTGPATEQLLDAIDTLTSWASYHGFQDAADRVAAFADEAARRRPDNANFLAGYVAGGIALDVENAARAVRGEEQ